MQKRWDPLPVIESDVVDRLMGGEMTIPEGREVVHGAPASEFIEWYRSAKWGDAVVQECKFLEELKSFEVQSHGQGHNPRKKTEVPAQGQGEVPCSKSAP